MPPAPKSTRRTRSSSVAWRWAIVIGIVVHAAGLWLLNVNDPRTGTRAAPPKAPDWVGDERPGQAGVLGEQMKLLDPEPLFLPTEWNYANAENRVRGSRAPGEIFGPFDPRFAARPGESPEGVLIVPGEVVTPEEALSGFPPPYLAGFGRVEADRVTLEPRLARVEVRPLIGGEVVVTETVPVEKAPAGSSWPGWAPFDAIVTVDTIGVQGPPLIPWPGSGAEMVDAFFRDYLKGGMRLDLKLSPGTYRVVIGP